MFTGIIQKIGTVVSIQPNQSGAKLILELMELSREIKLGSSVCVNGVCLTVGGQSGSQASFDVVFETLDRTNLGTLKTGGRVNLELAMKADDRFDGHFVQGHVDAACSLTGFQKKGYGQEMTLRLLQLDMMQYIIPKGSVAIDGISLTVAETYSDSFSVAVIPTTMLLTTLGEKKVGDLLNIETDILARTILSKLNRCSSDDSLRAKLIAGGFVKP